MKEISEPFEDKTGLKQGFRQYFSKIRLTNLIFEKNNEIIAKED